MRKARPTSSTSGRANDADPCYQRHGAVAVGPTRDGSRLAAIRLSGGRGHARKRRSAVCLPQRDHRDEYGRYEGNGKAARRRRYCASGSPSEA